MKLFTILFFLFVGGYALPSNAKSILVISGRITDATTNEPLAGAVVSIPELQVSLHTNLNGEYTFNQIPARGRFILEVRFIGYKTITQTVDLSSAEPLNFALQPSVIEVHEVVVTGTASSSNNRSNSTSVTTVGKSELQEKPSTNIIDAISRVPGVSQITTGAGISKPVIRGLSSNRVVTLSNGVKQEGQQWGDEHGIEIDQYSADRVEILRGAASLLYGSDALGGVINILDAVPPASGQTRGELISSYSTNNGLTSNSAMLQGNADGFVWQGRTTYKNAYSYNTPPTRIPNTAFNETNLSGMFGLTKPWGYSHLSFSSFNQKLGLPDFEPNDEGKFEDQDGNILTDRQLKDRELLLPYQDVRHYKIALNNQFLFNKGRLRSILAFQNNQRRELEESTTDPSLHFDLKTYSYDLKYYFEENSGWQPVIGASGAFQSSKNKAEELLIPDYDSKDLGTFAYLKKTWDKSSINAGIRFDYRDISGISMTEEGQPKFSNFSNTFSNFSGALGFTHNFDENWNLKANVGSAFRAPNIAELSSEGIHEGTFRFEVGNTSLNPERSLYTDVALEFHNKRADIHFNLYNNYISNYIYPRQINNETILVSAEEYPLYRYVQDNANLYGFEAGLTLHPTSLIHFENSFAITRGKNTDTRNDLPYIPAPLIRNELRIEPDIKSKGISNVYFSVELESALKQRKVDMEFETATSGYSLLHASIGATAKLGKQPIKMYVSGTNLLNRQYVSHLNRLKYEGFYNQGRNVNIGLIAPLKL